MQPWRPNRLLGVAWPMLYTFISGGADCNTAMVDDVDDAKRTVTPSPTNTIKPHLALPEAMSGGTLSRIRCVPRISRNRNHQSATAEHYCSHHDSQIDCSLLLHRHRDPSLGVIRDEPA